MPYLKCKKDYKNIFKNGKIYPMYREQKAFVRVVGIKDYKFRIEVCPPSSPIYKFPYLSDYFYVPKNKNKNMKNFNADMARALARGYHEQDLETTLTHIQAVAKAGKREYHTASRLVEEVVDELRIRGFSVQEDSANSPFEYYFKITW